MADEVYKEMRDHLAREMRKASIGRNNDDLHGALRAMSVLHHYTLNQLLDACVLAGRPNLSRSEG